MIETAVTLPLLLFLTLGTVDVGLGFKTYIALTTAAREGVRWVSVHPQDVAGALDRVATEADRVGLAPGVIGSGGIQISITPVQASYVAGEKVTVTVAYDYPVMFNALHSLPTLPLRAKATMVVLYDE